MGRNYSNISDCKAVPYAPFVDFVWTSLVLLDYVSFSGTLTLELDPTAIAEGEVILLFKYQQRDGNFSKVVVDAGSCTVDGRPQYDKSSLLFQITAIYCQTNGGCAVGCVY